MRMENKLSLTFNITQIAEKPIRPQENSTQNSTASNYSDSFIYSEFIQHFCKLGPKEKIITSDLYNYYIESSRGKVDTSRTFVGHMKKLFGYHPSNSKYYYRGINIDIDKVNQHNTKVLENNHVNKVTTQNYPNVQTLMIIPAQSPGI